MSAANLLIASADFSTAQASELKAHLNALSSLMYETLGSSAAKATNELAGKVQDIAIGELSNTGFYRQLGLHIRRHFF